MAIFVNRERENIGKWFNNKYIDKCSIHLECGRVDITCVGKYGQWGYVAKISGTCSLDGSFEIVSNFIPCDKTLEEAKKNIPNHIGRKKAFDFLKRALATLGDHFEEIQEIEYDEKGSWLGSII